MTGSRTRSVGLGLLIIVVNVLIVALVAIAVSQRGFSGWWATLRGEWVPLEDALEVEDPLAVDEEDPDVQTGPPDGASASTAPSTQKERERPAPLSAQELYEQGEEIAILVLGDRTGTHENDWPAAWGRILAEERAVEFYSPLAADPTQYGDPLSLGGDGAGVSIYNASFVDGTPAYAAERLPLLAAEEPDVILLSYGRSNTPEDLPEELDELWTAIGRTFPEVESYVVVAPPRLDGAEPTTEVTREWAEDAEAAVIDVARVFEDEGLVLSTQSNRDPLAVNIAGGQRWAQVVHQAVFGTALTAPEDEAAAQPSAQPPVDPAPTAAEPVPSLQPVPAAPTVQPAEPAPSVQPGPAPYIAPTPQVPSPSVPADRPPAVPTRSPGPAPAPAPTDPEPTDPEPTDARPPDPEPPDPQPTDPQPTDPSPTDDATGTGG